MTYSQKPFAPKSTTEALPNSLNELLAQTVARSPRATAFTHMTSGESFDFSQIQARSENIKQFLLTHQVTSGVRVGFITKTHIDFFSLLFGCAELGAVLIPLNPDWHEDEIKSIIKSSGMKILFLEDEQKLQISKKLVEQFSISQAVVKQSDNVTSLDSYKGAADRLEKPVITIYTSGSTGKSKGVVLSQKNLMSMARSIANFYQYDESTRLLSVLPYYHINAPMVTGLAAIYAGAQVFVDQPFGLLTARSFWKTVEKHQITVLSITPSIAASLFEAHPNGAKADIKSVKYALVGTAEFKPALWKDFENRFGIPCYQGYGLTETTTWIAMTPMGDAKRYDTAGIPVDCDIRIDTSIPDLAPQARAYGEILVRSLAIMTEYFELESETKKILQDGWLRTGDLGYIDTDGHLVISGRLKNTVKRNGILIHPEEVDHALSQLAGVVESKTFGHSDRLAGEKLICAIQMREGTSTTQEECREFLAKRLSNFKIPDQIIFVSQFPRNPVGKIDQKTLLALYTGELCEPIISEFNRYQYRRAESSQMPQIRDIIKTALVTAQPLKFVGYWGVGRRDSINEFDTRSMKRLSELVTAINDVCKFKFCEMTLVLADYHGKSNGLPESTARAYLGKIETLAHERGLRTVYLSQIWAAAKLNFDEVMSQIASPEFQDEWEAFPLKEDFCRQAGNRVDENGDVKTSAQRYYLVTQAEKKAVTEYFAGSILFTFSPPKLQCVFPLLPVLYWHSIKPGSSEKPWFID